MQQSLSNGVVNKVNRREFAGVLIAGASVTGSILTSALAQVPAGKSQALFDGKTLDGWHGDTDLFRIEDGAIVGGNLDQKNPRSGYLYRAERYRDFELSLQARIEGPGDNGGAQFRSNYDEQRKKMSGYQCDMGSLKGNPPTNLWGCIYDEGRRAKLLVIADQAKLERVFKPKEWNHVVVRAVGKRVTITVNGEQVTDYTESDGTIPQEGIFGLQVHGGPPCRVSYKSITVKVIS